MDFEQAREKVSTPATALLAVGVLGILAGLMGAAYTVFQVAMLVMNGGADALMAGGVQFVGSALWLFFNMILTAIVIFGATKMKKLESYNLALAASVLAAIPCCGVPVYCCIFGLPVGIWCIVTLMDDEVKAAFQNNAGAAM